MTITVRLDDDARRGWQKVADQHDLSLTALVEAMGRLLDQHPGRLDMDEVIALAKAIKAERASRKLGES